MPLKSQNLFNIQKKIKIFLIEDDEADQLLFRNYLQKLFSSKELYELFSYASFSQDLKTDLKKIDPDIVFLDLSLPGYDGLETIREAIKFINKPIVVLTSNIDKDMAFKSLRLGAQDYLVKSQLDPDKIDRAIVYSLQRFQLVHNLSIAQKLAKLGSWRLRVKDKRINCSSELFVVLGIENPNANEDFEVSDFLSLFSSNSQNKIQFQLKRVQKSKEQFELTVTSKDPQNKKFYKILGSPVFNDLNEVVQVEGTIQDVSERVKLEKMKDEFVSTVSHELRTPLAILKGVLSNLKDGIMGEISEPQKKCLEMGFENANRLGRIIDDLLDISRLESKEVLPQYESIDAKGYLDQIISDFKNNALDKQKKLDIDLKIQNKIYEFFADRELIQQVILNLLANAVRYAKSKIEIAVANVSEDGHIKISIEDDGDGIPNSALETIFDKFTQINRATKTPGYKGTGLGLAISKNIIESHNGKIWAESHVDLGGAKFSFVLPNFDANAIFHKKLKDLFAIASKSDLPLTLISIMLKNNDQQNENINLVKLSQELQSMVLRRDDSTHVDEETNTLNIFLMGNKDMAENLTPRLTKKLETFSCEVKSINYKVFDKFSEVDSFSFKDFHQQNMK